ncbi:MAG: asparagine synthase (glutamine-hydrolyzing) [Pseudomonadota bacterium]
MCGIAGFSGPGERLDLERMTRALAHRGPDGEGFHCDLDQSVFLGHRRLSIIDIANGAQPMWNEDRSVAVTYNGEIYNHLELRRTLEARGHVFSSDHSDTEVLVHGWEEWGEDLPLRLNGMFAFAIYDTTRRQIFLARDRFGEKPLYWARQRGLFLFASELSAITKHRGFQVALDRMALMKYYAHGFIPSPNALYQDCRKLPAGSWLRFDFTTGALREERYWSFSIEPAERPTHMDEAAEELRHLLMQSVERRLMSDVPLGVFLSGGVDSSAAIACAAKLRPETQPQSYSIGFKEKSFDESAFARAMAKAVGSDHHEQFFDLEAAHAILTEVLEHLDEPLGDPSILPTNLLCGFARKNVTVALSGDGGDELFAGYDTFAALKPARLYQAAVPRSAHRCLKHLVGYLPKSDANMSLDFKIRRALSGLDYGPDYWNPVWLAPLEAGDIAELFKEPVDPEALYSEALALWRSGDGKGDVDRTLEFYTRFYLTDDILTKADRASMFHGLEVRSVFLDNDLVEFVRCLPAHYKYRKGVRKFLLKQALGGLVPDDILSRPKKGFGIPIKAWLRAMKLDVGNADALGVDPSFVAQRIHAHQEARQDHRLFLWCWYAFQHRAVAG